MFPDPIKLPETVASARIERRKELFQAAKFGIAIRAGIVVFELFGVALFNSSSIWMDALSTLFDIASTFVLILCMKWAAKPPDEDHPFGHGRYEPLAGMQLGVLLILVGIGTMVYNAVMLGHHPEEIPMSSKAWFIPLIAMVLLEVSYHVVKNVAEKQHSTALTADAMHYRIDALTSLFATIALGAAAIYPKAGHYCDHAGATFIGVVMIVTGFLVSRSNLHQLMDKIPERKYFERIRRAAKSVDGVLGTEKIKVQIYGPDAHVDIDIEVDPKMPVDEAHKISQRVRVEIQKDWPTVRDVTVHIEPHFNR